MIVLRPKTIVKAYRFQDDGIVPNSLLPVVTYCEPLFIPPDSEDSKMGLRDIGAVLEELVAKNGWRVDSVKKKGVCPQLHYHSSAHKMLVILKGSVKLQLGGKQGRGGTFSSGDAIAIPVGVACQRLECSWDFAVASIFPKGQHWDNCRDHPDTYARAKHVIPRIKMPEADPFYGKKRYLMQHWVTASTYALA